MGKRKTKEKEAKHTDMDETPPSTRRTCSTN
jgi:hypothetical protein